jgi:uncharacterized protein
LSTAASTWGTTRIDTLDILRGFALFGILLINIIAFKSPGGLPGLGVTISAIDQAYLFLIIALVEAKFFTIFSFLFGLGFALQLSSTER